MKIQGETEGDDPYEPIVCRMKVTNFDVVDPPLLGRLLTIASLHGILGMLGDGLAVDEFSGEFSLQNKAITIESMRAYGSSLGLTGSGEIDFVTQAMDLNGAIIPAYLVTSLPGKIPFIGKALVGRKEEGLVAITYRMKGPIREPEITVNPASVLAPGFLRKMFDIVPQNLGVRDATGPIE